jgi:predicted flap endonuclease-1-like 5' DNA nuclease
MKVLRVFFLGLVYGLFMKYILDEIYTKNNLKRITNENALLRERIKSLEAKSLQRTEERLQPAQRTDPVTVSQPAETIASSRADDLKLIKGIGPQMEKKLNNAGVYTFQQMSRLTTTELQNILGLSKRVTQNADNLITQARKFAQQNSKR